MIVPSVVATPFGMSLGFLTEFGMLPIEIEHRVCASCAVCPNALKMNDPDCQNDGTLRALNNTDYLNCAYCNCPKEWKGAECNCEMHIVDCSAQMLSIFPV